MSGSVPYTRANAALFAGADTLRFCVHLISHATTGAGLILFAVELARSIRTAGAKEV
jgi:hypothetical protein